jgi:hypothetical protein
MRDKSLSFDWPFGLDLESSRPKLNSCFHTNNTLEMIVEVFDALPSGF